MKRENESEVVIRNLEIAWEKIVKENQQLKEENAKLKQQIKELQSK